MTEIVRSFSNINVPNTIYAQKITHLRNLYYSTKYSGGVTIISRLYRDEKWEPTALEYAVTFASPSHPYCRKFGVNQALDRLINKDELYYRRMRITSYVDHSIILMTIISDILLNVKHPTHANKILADTLTRMINNIFNSKCPNHVKNEILKGLTLTITK